MSQSLAERTAQTTQKAQVHEAGPRPLIETLYGNYALTDALGGAIPLEPTDPSDDPAMCLASLAEALGAAEFELAGFVNMVRGLDDSRS